MTTTKIYQEKDINYNSSTYEHTLNLFKKTFDNLNYVQNALCENICSYYQLIDQFSTYLHENLEKLEQDIENITSKNQFIINADITREIKENINMIKQIDFSNVEQLNIEIDASDLVNPVKEISETVEKLELSSKEATISDDRPIIVINNFISNGNNKKINFPTFINLVYTVIALIVMLSQNFEKDKTDKLFLDALNGIGTKISTSINNKD